MYSMKSLARLAGAGYLVIFATGFFANFFVLESMMVAGDASATLANLRAGEGVFRWGLLSFVVMVVFDLLLAWAFYLLFKPVNAGLSLLSAWFRLVNGAVFAVALYNLFGVLHLLGGAAYLQALPVAQLEAHIMLQLTTFQHTWLVGLIFFGIHLFILGWLVLQTELIPSVLGWLLFLAAAGYLTDSLARFMVSDYEAYANLFLLGVAVPGVVAELSLCLWLLIRGGRMEKAAN